MKQGFFARVGRRLGIEGRALRIRLDRANRRRLLDLRGIHTGQQCAVILGGPSVNEVDLSLLDGHPFVMGVNGAYMARDAFKYFFCSSRNFYIPNHERLDNVNAEKFFFSDDIPVRATPKRLYVCLNRQMTMGERGFSHDLKGTLPWGPTVCLDLVLPACVWMGFSEIILVGADYPLDSFTRHYDGRSGAPTRKGKIDNLAEMEKAHRGFDRIVEYLKEHGDTVKIFNCSPLSQLPHFGISELKDVIRR